MPCKKTQSHVNVQHCIWYFFSVHFFRPNVNAFELYPVTSGNCSAAMKFSSFIAFGFIESDKLVLVVYSFSEE